MEVEKVVGNDLATVRLRRTAVFDNSSNNSMQIKRFSWKLQKQENEMENLAFVHGTSRILSLTKVVISNAMPCIEASFYRLLYKNRFLLFL